MQLTKFIDKKCILPQLRASSKAEVLKELTNLLIEKKKIDAESATLEQIMARKKPLKEKVDAIRDMVDPRVLKQYDKLMLRRAPAVVPVEGDTCQGCFMKLPSQFAQRVRQEAHLLHVCNNCSRFIYVV